MSEAQIKRKYGKRLVVLVLLLAGVVVFGLIKGTVFKPSAESVFQRFAERARASTEVRLWEGLPSPGSAKVSMEEESKGKSTRRVHGYYFYEEPLKPDAALMEKVAAIVLDWKVTHPASEGTVKLCGKFHPDYMLEWTGEDGRKLEMMICFGCGDAKLFYEGDTEVLLCTLDKDQELKVLLADQRKNRPDEKRE
jgi:hypothetical protein